MEMTKVYAAPMLAEEMIALRAIDAANAELRARNEARLFEFKESMGTKYLLHPDNAPKRQEYVHVLSHKKETVTE